jgi:hypothetical protein
MESRTNKGMFEIRASKQSAEEISIGFVFVGLKKGRIIKKSFYKKQ